MGKIYTRFLNVHSVEDLTHLGHRNAWTKGPRWSASSGKRTPGTFFHHRIPRTENELRQDYDHRREETQWVDESYPEFMFIPFTDDKGIDVSVDQGHVGDYLADECHVVAHVLLHVSPENYSVFDGRMYRVSRRGGLHFLPVSGFEDLDPREGDQVGEIAIDLEHISQGTLVGLGKDAKLSVFDRREGSPYGSVFGYGPYAEFAEKCLRS